MREGLKSTEGVIGIAAVIFVALQRALWPDSPFPTVEFSILMMWVGARFTEKTIGPTDTNGKRAWQTPGFWIATVFSVVKYVFPTVLPEGVENFIFLLIGGDTAVRTLANKDFTK